jgi:hypothetical protein
MEKWMHLFGRLLVNSEVDDFSSIILSHHFLNFLCILDIAVVLPVVVSSLGFYLNPLLL